MSQILEISRTRRETADSLLISLNLPQNLRKMFNYCPGQYITLETQINGNSYKRPYSLCGSIEEENELSILVKRVPGGLVSNFLNDFATPGTAFKVAPPQGNFKIAPGMLKMNHYVFFAAGCGITPIISMIENVLLREPFSKATLFYSSKSWESTIFRARIKTLFDAYTDRFKVQMIITTPEPGKENRSRLTREGCYQLLTTKIKNCRKAKYYMCGPAGFMEDIISSLQALQVPEKNINFEYFGPEALSPLLSVSGHTAECLPAIEAPVEVIVGSKPHIIRVGSQQSILDSTLEAELDVNYSCRSGNCSACKAKLLSGQVSSKPFTGLSKKEIEAGYILTCQSQPATPDVKVRYCS